MSKHGISENTILGFQKIYFKKIFMNSRKTGHLLTVVSFFSLNIGRPRFLIYLLLAKQIHGFPAHLNLTQKNRL